MPNFVATAGVVFNFNAASDSTARTIPTAAAVFLGLSMFDGSGDTITATIAGAAPTESYQGAEGGGQTNYMAVFVAAPSGSQTVVISGGAAGDGFTCGFRGVDAIDTGDPFDGQVTDSASAGSIDVVTSATGLAVGVCGGGLNIPTTSDTEVMTLPEEGVAQVCGDVASTPGTGGTVSIDWTSAGTMFVSTAVNLRHTTVVAFPFVEDFENAGYKNSGWSESIGAGGVVNEDESTDNAGQPKGWGAQCLLITHASGTASSTTHAISPSLAKSFCSLEARVASESLSDGQNNTLARGQTTAGAQDIWVVRIAQASGIVSLEVAIFYDGSTHTVYSKPITLNQAYRVEVNWDSLADIYTVWVDGMMVAAGALSGSAAGWQFDTILLGDAGSSGGSTYRLDNFQVAETYIGPSVEFDMTWVTGDRIKETTTTTGTGDITLGGAVSGYQAFSVIAADLDQVIYAIVGATEWEVGLGTWHTGGTLTRTRVFSSSNSGALVSFSAGTKNVFVPLPAAQAGTPVTNKVQKFSVGVPVDGAVYAEGDYEIASGKELDLAQGATLEVG